MKPWPEMSSTHEPWYMLGICKKQQYALDSSTLGTQRQQHTLGRSRTSGNRKRTWYRLPWPYVWLPPANVMCTSIWSVETTQYYERAAIQTRERPGAVCRVRMCRDSHKRQDEATNRLRSPRRGRRQTHAHTPARNESGTVGLATTAAMTAQAAASFSILVTGSLSLGHSVAAGWLTVVGTCAWNTAVAPTRTKCTTAPRFAHLAAVSLTHCVLHFGRLPIEWPRPRLGCPAARAVASWRCGLPWWLARPLGT